MAAPAPLPASPAYELGNAGFTATLGRAIVVGGQGSKDNVYRAPAGFQNEDLSCGPGCPPKSLGDFYPKQKTSL